MREQRARKLSFSSRMLVLPLMMIGGTVVYYSMAEDESGVAARHKESSELSLLDGLGEMIAQKRPLEVSFVQEVLDYDTDWKRSRLGQDLLKGIRQSGEVSENEAVVRPVFIALMFRYPPDVFPAQSAQGLIEIDNPPSPGSTQSNKGDLSSREQESATSSTSLLARFRDDAIPYPRADLVVIVRSMIRPNTADKPTHNTVRTVMATYYHKEQRWVFEKTTVQE